MHAQGEHENSTQKDPNQLAGSNPEPALYKATILSHALR